MTDHQSTALDKLRLIWQEETSGLHARLLWLVLLEWIEGSGLSPLGRADLYRAQGLDIGVGTSFAGKPRFTGYAGLLEKVHIGRNCRIGMHCSFDLQEDITLEDDVTLGDGVLFITQSHEIGPPHRRAGLMLRGPIVIGRGATLGERVLIAPGVVIGAGATILAGSILTKEVPPGVTVGGNPAVIRPEGR